MIIIKSNWSSILNRCLHINIKYCSSINICKAIISYWNKCSWYCWRCSSENRKSL